MKVGLLGNMNNNFFAVARYLRDWGVDADVLLFDDEFEHFHPSADSYDLSYASFCRQLTWGSPARFRETAPKRIKADLAPYDVLVGCGFSPAYCHRVGRALDIFAPYGGDIAYGTSYRLVRPQRIHSVWRAVHEQRKALPEVKVVNMGYSISSFEEPYRRYRGNSERWYEIMPMVYERMYRPESLAENGSRTRWFEQFKRIRANVKVMLFGHARHEWGRRARHDDHKGNDHLLRGFAAFRKRNPHVSAGLVQMEYGSTVRDSKALIRDLGIAKDVYWFPRMPRKDLMAGLALADIGCAEFAISWLYGGVILETLALGKPLLGYRDDDLYRGQHEELYPMMNARNAAAVCAELEAYVANPAKYVAQGEQGHAWYLKHAVEATRRKYMKYIDEKAANLGRK
jgi:glycosyltransferase involved in cell wall biosynthesis